MNQSQPITPRGPITSRINDLEKAVFGSAVQQPSDGTLTMRTPNGTFRRAIRRPGVGGGKNTARWA